MKQDYPPAKGWSASGRTKIPTSAGVYFFLNDKGQTIYIGKAKNLRNRIASYWIKGSELSPAKQEMVRQTKDIDFTVVDNETEALLLEAGLIRKHMPDFNIVLRDDKSWSHIVITAEAFPRILTVHGRKKLKGKYYGPYTSAVAARTMVRFLHKILPLRTCHRDLSKLPKGKVCIQYGLGKCLGPCEKFLSAAEYAKFIKQAEEILKGKGQHLYKELQRQMAEASSKQNYELAAKLRNKIWAWKKINQPQNVFANRDHNQDVISVININKESVITILQIRQGQVLDKFNYLMKRPLDQTSEETLETALAQHYTLPEKLPKEIILPLKPSRSLKQILQPAKLLAPAKGSKKKLLELAEKNAWSYYQRINSQTALPKILFDLQQLLDLPQVPVRIEFYDISNIQGNWNVGSLVVLEAGVKKPSEYKKFKINTVDGADDVHAMKEMLERRQKHDDWPQPDLIVLDGGKPQLNTVVKILRKDWQGKIISLAKKQEEIFIPKKYSSLKLPKDHPVSLLLQQGRNEAHRSAIRYYRLLHKKSLNQSGSYN